MTAKEIKAVRTVLKLTQEQFSDLLCVSFTTVSRWENGHGRPTGLSLQFLSHLYQVRRNGRTLSELQGTIRRLKIGSGLPPKKRSKHGKARGH